MALAALGASPHSVQAMNAPRPPSPSARTPQNQAGRRPRRRRPIARLAGAIAGWVLLIVGIITTPTPIPIGLVLVAFGLFLLARDSRMARRGIRALRSRFATLDNSLSRLSSRLPRAVRTVIRRTAPLASRRLGTRGRSD